MTDLDKEQLWNCISKMKSMPWKKPRGGEHNWDYPSMRKLFEKLVVYSDANQPTAAWKLLNSGKYKYMIYPWYKSQLYNCIAFSISIELRDDGGYELRDDLGYELR